MASLLERLTPDEYVSSVYHIDLDKLWKCGKRLIMTDLDNTLVPWNDPSTSEQLLDWLKKANDRGFQICIVSNNRGPRVETFAEVVGVAAIGKAKKPRPDAFQQALSMFGLKASEGVMVGDQLFTDIRGGKRLGIYSILVLPIHPTEWWGTRVVRKLERLVMRMLIKRGLKVPTR